ncbi:MAG: glycosyltransferase family 39 protein [Bryobacterales bacterium]
MEPHWSYLLVRELFAAALTLTTAALLGRALMGPLGGVRAALTRSEYCLFSFGIGAAALSFAVLALAVAHLAYDAAFWALAILSAAAWFRWGRNRGGEATSPPLEGGWVWRSAWYVAFCVYGWLYLINALAPEIGSDSLGYHLGLVFRYYRDHQLTPITTSIYAFLSQGAEMLYLFAFAFARHDGPKLVHLAFLFGSALGIILLARRAGHHRAGYLAALLYFCSPVVGNDAITAYNDCMLAFYQLLLFYGLLVWNERRDPQWALVLGVLAGFGFGIKFTAVFAAAGAFLAFAYGQWKANRAAFLKPVALFILAAAPLALPWPARNWIVAGNPVAPFYNDIFPNPYVTIDWERNYRKYLLHYKIPEESHGWRDYLERPLEATWYGRRLGGFTGPVFLAAPLALLAIGRPLAGPLWGAVGLTILPWLISNGGTRFLIPPMVFLSLLMAIAVDRFGRKPGAVIGLTLALFHSVSSWPWAIREYHPLVSFWRIDDYPWPVVTGRENRHEFLNRHVYGYTVMRALSKLAPAGSKVFALGGLPEAYFPGELVVGHQGGINSELARELLAVIEPDFFVERIWRLPLPQPAEVSAIRLEQTNSHETSWWEIGEIRLLRDGKPVDQGIPRTASTDIFPFTAQRMVDGDILTVWRSWQPIIPGYVEVDLERPVEADTIELRIPRGQHFPRYQCAYRDPAGQWHSFEPKIEEEYVETTPEQRKRQAWNALRAQGIGYLISNVEEGGHNIVAKPIDEDPSSWGLEELWRDGPFRIYKLSPTFPE